MHQVPDILLELAPHADRVSLVHLHLHLFALHLNGALSLGDTLGGRHFFLLGLPALPHWLGLAVVLLFDRFAPDFGFLHSLINSKLVCQIGDKSYLSILKINKANISEINIYITFMPSLSCVTGCSGRSHSLCILGIRSILSHTLHIFVDLSIHPVGNLFHCLRTN